jgi:hypothetical protein
MYRAWTKRACACDGDRLFTVLVCGTGGTFGLKAVGEEARLKGTCQNVRGNGGGDLSADQGREGLARWRASWSTSVSSVVYLVGVVGCVCLCGRVGASGLCRDGDQI